MSILFDNRLDNKECLSSRSLSWLTKILSLVDVEGYKSFIMLGDFPSLRKDSIMETSKFM